MSPPPRPIHLEVPDYGVGAGLRVPHYQAILDTEPKYGFFEIISENFMEGGGRPQYFLEKIAERYPIVLHGVSLSIGAPEEPDRGYLEKLRALVRRLKPAWVTDHVCWASAGGVHLHDLLPLPYTEEALVRVVRRAKMIQDFLEVPFGLENTSSYLNFTSSVMSEWEFVSRLASEADIGLLLDVNNIYVSAHNHGFSALAFLESLPHERVLQIHVAGHTDKGKYLLDTHRGPIREEVLDLYERATRLGGPRSTLVEWDDHIPPLEELSREVARVAAARDFALTTRGAAS